MFDVITIAGSPSATSRSSAVLTYVGRVLEDAGLRTGAITVRDLPAADLMHGRFDSPAVEQAARLIDDSRSVIVATPIYKAAYSGVLKSFLDLLPQKALTGKIVLPIAIGGSPAHMLAIDYALNPVLASLGVQHLLRGVYMLDSQVQVSGDDVDLEPIAAERLDKALRSLIGELASHNGHFSKEVQHV